MRLEQPRRRRLRFDEAVEGGGDLAAAAEQAELEELRRLEAMLAHEEEMRRSTSFGVLAPAAAAVYFRQNQCLWTIRTRPSLFTIDGGDAISS